MTDRATLEALLARVLEGTGPDRELDAEIHAATLYIKPIIPEAVVMRECQENGFYAIHYVPGSPGSVSYWHQAPPFTGSLDAVLRDLLLKGWGWAISTTGDLVPCAYGHSPDRSFWVDDTKAATPARAVCAFALRARIWIALQISGGKDEPVGN